MHEFHECQKKPEKSRLRPLMNINRMLIIFILMSIDVLLLVLHLSYGSLTFIIFRRLIDKQQRKLCTIYEKLTNCHSLSYLLFNNFASVPALPSRHFFATGFPSCILGAVGAGLTPHTMCFTSNSVKRSVKMMVTYVSIKSSIVQLSHFIQCGIPFGFSVFIPSLGGAIYSHTRMRR